jgi:uncharacterized coiled-coil protein SlyX
MSDHDDESREKLAQRLTECETLLTHVQRALQDLDGVVLSHGKRIESLEKRLERLAEFFGALRAGPTEDRRPEDEKPPHY